MGARLDQHFLVDPSVRDAVVSAACLRAGDPVLEIGPGKGILTSALLARGGRVTAVEKDEGLAAALEGASGLRLITADFLFFDLSELGAGPMKVVGNLPYSVATPILQKLLLWPGWSEAVLMFQKEVAERITAEPGCRDYGILTLSVKARARAELILEVSRDCFRPRPKVASAVVRLVRLEPPLLPPEREKRFFHIAKSAFSQRRKMAAGLIARAAGVTRERAAGALESLGLSAGCRAEDIPFEAFVSLAEELGAPS